MRNAQLILVALALACTGCETGSRGIPPKAPQGITLTAPLGPEGLPVVLFRLWEIRDWESPWYIVRSLDVDLTLPAALELGIPAELWIRCAIENPKGFRQEIYWVRPLRC